MELSGLHERLRDVIGDRSFRAVGDLTQHNPETVRRYLIGQAPSVEFIAAVCHRLDVHADWLLTGRGPMRASEVRAAALKSARPEELLNAMATTLEQMVARVDRIETYVQTLEARVRARITGLLEEIERPFHGASAQQAHPQDTPARAGRARARDIADALPERPREDVGGTPPTHGP